MLYIMRRTYGFKKRQDAISYSQFLYGITCRDGRQLDQGAGISSDRTLSAALDNLCDKWHLLFRHRQRRPDGVKTVTIYELNLDGQSHYQPGQTTGEPQCGPDEAHQSLPTRLETTGEGTAKIAGRGTAKIAGRGTAKIADTTNSINNKQFKQHTQSVAEQKPLVCVSLEEPKQHIPETTQQPELEPTAIAVRGTTDWGYDILIKAGVKPAKARQYASTDPNYLERVISEARSKNNPAGYIVTMLGLGADPRPKAARSSHERPGTAITVQKYQNIAQDETEPETAQEPTNTPPIQPNRIDEKLRYSLTSFDRAAAGRLRHLVAEGSTLKAVFVGSAQPDLDKWLNEARIYYPQVEHLEISLR